jgi:4a-hydroxytetrahydrobiopterin dehydratase
MNELAQQHCVAVSATTPKLSDGEIKQNQAKLPGWKLYDDGGARRLERSFKFDDFTQAMEFTNELARMANEEDHHPAILTEWGKVTVNWWTHKIKGLHLNDFIMAAKTDQLYERSR